MKNKWKNNIDAKALLILTEFNETFPIEDGLYILRDSNYAITFLFSIDLRVFQRFDTFLRTKIKAEKQEKSM